MIEYNNYYSNKLTVYSINKDYKVKVHENFKLYEILIYYTSDIIFSFKLNLAALNLG